MNMGKGIKIALLKKGVSQKALSELLGVSNVYVNRICNQGSIGMESMKNVADALEMKLSDLIALGEE